MKRIKIKIESKEYRKGNPFWQFSRFKRVHKSKKTWFSFPIDENKVDSHEIQVNLSVGRVKTIQDTKKYYSSQTCFYGKLALFHAIKYKLCNRNYKLIVKL